jgi:hypothetical protein
MTRNGRDQRGYAEPPFAPTDAPQDREALHAKGTRAELPFTAWGLVEWTSYDPADGGAAHRVLVRGEQPESLGGPHQGVDATLGYAVSR